MLASFPSLDARPSCRCNPIALTVLDRFARRKPVPIGRISNRSATQFILRTTLNLALPLIIRSYAA